MRNLLATTAVLALLALPTVHAAAPRTRTSIAKPARRSSARTATARRPAIRPAPRTIRPKASYQKALTGALRTLAKQGRPTIVRLKPQLPTIVIPDVHARTGFIASVLKAKDPTLGRPYGQLLREGRVQIVVVGDGMHSEARAEGRWQKAEKDPFGKAMEAEIAESLGTMKQIMELKAAHPDHFHYLKGNHDNILDEQKGGNYPVLKYTNTGEGQLVKNYIQRTFGAGFLAKYAEFERSLPLLAVGNELAISHSAPAAALDRTTISRRSGRVVENFTWTDLTDNTPKQARIVNQQLRELGLGSRAVYVAGHRPTGNRLYRRQGQLIQVNADDKLLYVVVEPGRRFDPGKDVRRARPVR